jgi:hypothetical protein
VVPPRRERSRTGDPRRAGYGALTKELVVANVIVGHVIELAIAFAATHLRRSREASPHWPEARDGAALPSDRHHNSVRISKCPARQSLKVSKISSMPKSRR